MKGQQGSLFDVDVETERNPLCPYEVHCGRRCELGAWRPVKEGGVVVVVNRTITAIGCLCHGEQSVKPERAKERGWHGEIQK